MQVLGAGGLEAGGNKVKRVGDGIGDGAAESARKSLGDGREGAGHCVGGGLSRCTVAGVRCGHAAVANSTIRIQGYSITIKRLQPIM